MHDPDVPHLRPAATADAPEIARLSEEWGYPTSPDTVAAGLARLAAVGGRELVLVAEGEGGLVGWLHIGTDTPLTTAPRAHLHGLVVDARSRRQGVGRALVAAAESWAVGQGLGAVILRSRTTREESHHFYPELGYQLVKTQRVYQKRLPARGGDGGPG